MLTLLESKAWTPTELATRLDIDEQDAAKVLEAIGPEDLSAIFMVRFAQTLADVAAHPSPRGILTPKPEWIEESVLAISRIIEDTGQLPTDEQWGALTISSWHRHHDEERSGPSD